MDSRVFEGGRVKCESMPVMSCPSADSAATQVWAAMHRRWERALGVHRREQKCSPIGSRSY